MSELKPCPFCGSKAHTSLIQSMWFVECDNKDCGALMGFDAEKVNQEEAISAWNRRAQPANEPLTDHIADATEMVPLTLEGIREAVDNPDSDSAVWVNEINTDVWIRAILDEDAERGVFAVWHGGEDQSDFYTEKDYGKSWLAYAHRPGGEQT